MWFAAAEPPDWRQDRSGEGARREDEPQRGAQPEGEKRGPPAAAERL